jgi:predicted DsbA family dithiol-disulfide isomerase
MSVRKIKLTVINDLVCQYCFVGFRELLDAVDICKQMGLPVEFQIEYRPFRLIGCLPENKTVKKEDFYVQYLGQKQFDAMRETMMMWGEKKGEKVSFGGVVSQTTYAHRLSRKAYLEGGQDLQLPLLSAVFKAYCGEEKDIGDVEILGDIAESVGMMSKEETIRFLESDELKDEVLSMAEEARSRGISGIPFTVIEGKWAVSGGKSADVYVQIFQKMATCNSKSPVSGTISPEVECSACTA